MLCATVNTSTLRTTTQMSSLKPISIQRRALPNDYPLHDQAACTNTWYSGIARLR